MKCILAVLLLAGCAGDGIRFDAGDRERCRAEGCTVWTEAELKILISKVAHMTAQSCRRGTAI